eukprot:6174985-Pleurochrysis_carterae.AAC.1
MGQKNLAEMNKVDENRKGVGEKKRTSSTAPAVCAREVLWRGCIRIGLRGRLLKRPRHYSALTNALVLLLPVPTSDSHVFRHVVSCRFSARGNLHGDLDLAARPAVLARAQP